MNKPELLALLLPLCFLLGCNMPQPPQPRTFNAQLEAMEPYVDDESDQVEGYYVYLSDGEKYFLGDSEGQSIRLARKIKEGQDYSWTRPGGWSNYVVPNLE